MKRWLGSALLLGLGSLLAVPDGAASSEPGAGKKVGVMWLDESAAAQRLARSFRQEMIARTPGIEIEIQSSPDDKSASLYRRFQRQKDALLFLGGGSARYLSEHPSTVPAFIAELGAPLDSPPPAGTVLGGVTDQLPARLQLERFRELFPELRSVGLLTGSAAREMEARAACSALHIDCQVRHCLSKRELVAAVKDLRCAVDLLILDGQPLLVANSAVAAVLAGATPLLSFSPEAVGRGALGGLSADPETLGALLAELVHAVLVRGEAPAESPLRGDPKPRFLLDRRRFDELGLVATPAFLAAAKQR